MKQTDVSMANDVRSPISRRDTLRFSLAAGACAVLSGSLEAATSDPEKLPLITKAIPTSGEKLPVIGLGTDQFAPASARQSRRKSSAWSRWAEASSTLRPLTGTARS